MFCAFGELGHEGGYLKLILVGMLVYRVEEVL